jgi:hypothetical protein
MLMVADWDAVFGLASTTALLGWAVLLLAPRGGRLRLLGVVPRLAVPLALSAVYAALVMVHFAAAGGGYGSLAEVRALFASDPMLVAGWTHYLAFDLLVGVMIADRMDRAGVPRLVQAMPLVATFLFGPVGLLLGLGTEAVARALVRPFPGAVPARSTAQQGA